MKLFTKLLLPFALAVGPFANVPFAADAPRVERLPGNPILRPEMLSGHDGVPNASGRARLSPSRIRKPARI